jgi:hypothetical protein
MNIQSAFTAPLKSVRNALCRGSPGLMENIKTPGRTLDHEGFSSYLDLTYAAASFGTDWGG